MPPVTQGGLEELEGAGDVGGDELPRAVDRAVDVRFGGQMHDRLRLGVSEGPAQGLGIADIGLDEGEAGLALQVGKGGQIAGVGELIDDRDVMSARDQEAGQIRPDEARAAGDQNTHKQWWVKSGNTGGEARKKAARSARLVDLLNGWPVGQSEASLVDPLTRWPVGQSDTLIVDRLNGWPVGQKPEKLTS